mgnify:FL=1
MTTKRRYKPLLLALLFGVAAFGMPVAAHAQSVTNMINGDTIYLDGCLLGSGTIYDDGGANGNYSNNFDGWVVIQTSAGLTITLTGNYVLEGCCDPLSVYDGGNTLVDGVVGTGTVDVSSTTGLMYIHFHSDGSVNYNGLVLQWSVNGISETCLNPVTNLDTALVTATTIGLTWNAVNSAGPFTVVCNDQTFGGITTTSYTLTGLNPSSSYDIGVVATAAQDNRCCGDYMTVRTACDNTDLPYSEGFEGMAEGSFPSCWLQVVNFDDEDYLPQVESSHHSSGVRSMMLSCGNMPSDGHYGIIATPPLEGTGSHTVRLQLRASHSDVYVELGTCDADGTDYNQYGFTPVQGYTVGNTTSWNEYSFTWAPSSNGRRLALRMQQSQQAGTGRRLYIDDVSIENCGVDSVRTIHVEYDRLTLLWSTYGGPTCTVGVRREGALTDTLTFPNATSPLNITGLAADTRYVFTVYPSCSGTPSISRSVTARTSVMPTSANGYCSNFSQSFGLPSEWTFQVVNNSCNGSFSRNGRTVRYSDGCSGSEAYMASERLLGLPGQQVAVTFDGDNNGAMIILGTMVHADDPSTFVPLDTMQSDGARHTMTATVPLSSTGRHIALRFINPGWYISANVYAVTCSACPVAEDVVLHRRGTSIELEWAQSYSAVQVQYGPEGFALGSGTVVTFNNAARGTLDGLAPGTNYDLFIYRPCQTPCEDMRRTVRTATRDYPLPYCESFDTLDEGDWDYNWGDWRNMEGINGCPRFSSVPYYSGELGRSMEMSSWGFTGDYRSTVALPDVEMDTSTYLSFYVNDNAPQSNLIVATIPDRYIGNNHSEGTVLQLLDTIHVNAYNHRRHYTYALRPSDTLFDCRLVLRYTHPYEYSYFNCYIDELQISHAAYGELQNIYTGFDTVAFNLTSLVGASSVEVTLEGGGFVVTDTIALADIHSFGFGGLDTGSFYRCYVRPLPDGCRSYAGYAYTRSYGVGGYGNCFTFDDVLSYELPAAWAADGTTQVTTGDYLQVQAHGSVAVNPAVGLDNQSLSFRARSTVEGDTLLVGTVLANTISTDSTHFTFQPAGFTVFDTFRLAADWQYYTLRLPSTGADTVRLVFVAGNGTTSLDEIGFSGCPIVHFTVNGNQLDCVLDDDQSAQYYLYISDSAGTDNRIVFVQSNPYRVEGLLMNRRYDLSWQCLYQGDGCRPTVSVHTGGLIPLPYCENFNVSNGSIKVPPTWTFVKNNNGNVVTLDNWGPDLRMDPYNNRWMYAVLPEFDVDSALSLQGYIYTWTDGGVQIGVMDSATDTASFIPLWTSANNNWQYPRVDLSAYVDKRVAIRTRSDMRIFYLHVYGLPLPHYSLVASRQMKVTSGKAKPYYLRYRNSWDTSQDTVFYVDTTVYYIQDTFFHSRYSRIIQIDSTGYSCENDVEYNMSERHSLPFCFDFHDNWGYPNGSMFYQPYNQNGVNYTYNDDDRRVMRFYQNNSQWMVMPDFEIDSIRHGGLRVHYRAASLRDTLVVGIMEDAYDTLTFTPLDTLFYTRSDDSLQAEYIDLSAYTGEGRWIAFHHPRCPRGNWFDISKVYVDRCPAALGATASLSRWNRVKIDGLHVPFYVEYGYSGTWQGDGSNTILRIDSVPTELTLDPETRYDFFFRCDSAGYTCAPRQQVVTLAAPLALPTCVDFDTVAATLVPHNWIARNPGIGATNSVSHSDTNCLVMPVATNSYIITPDIDVDSIQKVAVSIWYQVEDLSDRLVVGVMSNPTDLATFHPVRSLAPLQAGVWQRGMVDFSNAPDDAHFIALRARSNRQAGGRNIYVDDIYITDCAAFDFAVQSLTNSSIDLTWSQRGNPNITVTVEDDGVQTAVYNNITPPLHIEPLDMLHYYTFNFFSTCDSNNSTGFCSTNYEDSLSVVTPAPGTGCINPTDLNSPQAVFFRGSYNNPYSQAGAVNYGSQHPDSRHTVCYDTAQRDPRTGNQLRTIPEGYTSSVRLGNWSTNYFEPEAEGVIYSLLVDTSSFELLLLRYAAVLQDPNHAATDQPRFRMELLDTNYNIIDSACTSADFIANQNLGWHTADDGVLWKDWTAVGVDLSAHAGEQVYFRLTTYDCNEGSHYGYAYFTLECMRKNMNTVSCGNVDSNTLSAPEGFHYRWYTSQSGATFSTAQNITVPSEDITYFCEVSKLDNPSCNFTISAYGGTRFPVAAFDTTMVVDSCRFYVSFVNQSGVSRDAVTLIPGERCETYYWDFGNGTVSTSMHPQTVYTQPGTYTIRLICGIGMDECQDTAYMTLVLDLPPGMAPSDTTAVSICDNQWYLFHGQPYNTTGTYYHNVPLPNSQCDSIYVLLLDVRATSSSDTVGTVCDSITWRGSFLDTTGVYMSAPVGLNAVGCDSTRRLTLTVNYSKETVDSIVICPGYPFIYRGVDYGGPAVFDALLTTRQNCDSLVHVTLYERDANYRVETYYRFDSTDWTATDSLLSGCAPTTLDVIDSTVGTISRTWAFFMRDTSWMETDTVFTVQFDTFRVDMTAYLTLDVIDTLGCHDTLMWPVFVFQKPVPEFRWEPEVPPMHNPEAQFFNLTMPDTSTYLWSIQQIEGGGFDTTSVVAPFYHWGEDGDNMVGDYTVRLVASLLHNADSFRVDTVQWVDSALRSLLLYEAFTYSCVDSVEHTITITNDYLQFPNLVTPNGDGTNDTWEVVNLLEFGNYQMNELWIYDRTGALVYHVKNISRADQFWDPNATRSPDGTYYFRFSARGPYGLVKRNGSIEVLR